MSNGRVPEDLTGRVFGRLTVIELAPRERDEFGRLPQRKWICKCACGCTKTLRGDSLTSGNTKSCGCLLLALLKRPRNRPFKRPFRRYFNIKELNEHA